ncbi:MAG TPA: UMP kinase [Candidatus Korarchaeota archaeon]|nr:UMP kinase [Candidatus Korarchaeota archaeon]
MRLTLLLGGIVFDRAKEDQTILDAYRDIIIRLVEKGYKLIVVAGGGRLAREYIESASRYGVNKAFLDYIGIMATRLNAALVIASLWSRAYPRVPETYEEALSGIHGYDVVVMGGMAPAQSTDAVAAVMSEMTNSKLMIKATGAKGVYDRPPEEPGATFIPRITYKDLLKIVQRYQFEPGKYELLDPIAIKVLERSKVRCIILNGLEPQAVLGAVSGEEVGTVVGEVV